MGDAGSISNRAFFNPKTETQLKIGNVVNSMHIYADREDVRGEGGTDVGVQPSTLGSKLRSSGFAAKRLSHQRPHCLASSSRDSWSPRYDMEGRLPLVIAIGKSCEKNTEVIVYHSGRESAACVCACVASQMLSYC